MAHCAAVASKGECFNCASNHNGDLTVTNAAGETPLETAKKAGHQLLMEKAGWSLLLFSFPFSRGEAIVIRHSTIWLLSLFCFHCSPYCSSFLYTFLPPLPFSDLSSYNPPILPVVYIVFRNLLVSLSQIFSVISSLSFVLPVL